MIFFPTPQKVAVNNKKNISLNKQPRIIAADSPGCNPLIRICREEIKRLFQVSGAADGRQAVFYFKTDPSLFGDYTGQAYTVRNDCSGKIRITGSSPQGILYGIQTLKQIYEETRPGLPECEIADWPDFQYRLSANWLHNCEVARWGYDRGQGISNFIKDARKRIDWALKYKINLIHLDVSHADFRPDEFPDFATIVQNLNRYARERGIKLMSGGILSFGMKNRTHYPDGEVYKCIGRKYRAGQEDAFIGAWCFSNRDAWKIKYRRLEDYVRAVEPGALYLHSIDIGDYRGIVEAWGMRCKKCRTRWPDDRIESPEGLAGAYAEVQNGLLETVRGVKNAETGYDGGKDCLITLATSPYTIYLDNDDDWEKELKFYETLSRELKYVENVQFIIREQGFRKTKDVLRVKELTDRINRKGRGHGLFVGVFPGLPGSGSSVRPAPGISFGREIFAVPVMYGTLKGARTVASFEASADREVNAVLSASYSWNSKPDCFYEKPVNYREWVNVYVGSFSGYYYPNEVHGKNGLVSAICEKMYGKKAGGYIARAISLRSISSPGMEITPLGHIEFLQYGRKRWRPDLPAGQMEEWVEYWTKTKAVSLEALVLFEKGWKQKDFNREYSADIDWRIKTMKLGILLLDFFRLESTACLENKSAVFNNTVERCENFLWKAEVFVNKNFPEPKKQFFQPAGPAGAKKPKDRWVPEDDMLYSKNGLLSNMSFWLVLIGEFRQELEGIQKRS